MKTIQNYLWMFALIALLPLTGQSAELDRLAGKWAVEKKTEYGEKAKYILEFKGETFKFWIKSLEGQTAIYAEGKAKVSTVGDLKVLLLTDIKGGESEDNISPIYDDRSIVYRMGYKSLTLATNFESHRDEEPSMDTYKKVD